MLRQALDFTGERSPRAAARQILRSFAAAYPEEFSSLEKVLAGDVGGIDPSLCAHAIDFGFCTQGGDFAMRALRTTT